MKIYLRLAIILFGFSLYVTAAYAAPLSDRQAMTILDNMKWFKIPREIINLGQFAVVGGVRNAVGVRDNYFRREITENTLKKYKAWESQGIIKVQEIPYDPGTMKKITDLTKGIIMRVNITATAKGIALDPPGKKSLVFPVGTVKISKIIRNEERKIGISEYRIIMFNYNAKWWPPFKKVDEQRGMRISEKRKAIFLLKYDPFQNKWKFVTLDLANRDESFQTSRVNNYILQQGSPRR